MGSNVAPPYACSFMHDFEQKHIFFNDLFREHCATWWRYIDDIFAIWRGNIESLKTFDEMINSISPNIQFKIHIGGDSVPFLDIRAYIKQGRIETDIYTKPTDRNQLLRYHSYHPPHVFSSIIRSQLLRVMRIVSDTTIRDQRLDEMCCKFKERGYPEGLIRQELDKILNPIKISNKKRYLSDKPRIPFVFQFSSYSDRIFNVLRKHWTILKRSYPQRNFN